MTNRQKAMVIGLGALICLMFVFILYLQIDYSLSTQPADVSLSSKATSTSLPISRPTFPPTWTPTSIARPTAKLAPTATPETAQPILPASSSSTSCLVGTWRFDDLAAHLLTLVPDFMRYKFNLVDYQGEVVVTFTPDGKVDLQANRFTARIANQYIEDFYSFDGHATAEYVADDIGMVTLTNIDLLHLRLTEVWDAKSVGVTHDLTKQLVAAAAGAEPPIPLKPFSATVALDCSDRTLKYAPGVQPLRLERIQSADNAPASSCLVGTWGFTDTASIILVNTRYYDGVAHIADNQGRLTYSFSPNGKVIVKAEQVVVTLGVVDKPIRGNSDLIFSFNGQVSANYSTTGTHTVVLSNVNARALTTKAIARIPVAKGPPAEAQLAPQDEMPPFLGLVPFAGQSDMTAMYRCDGDVLEYQPAWPLTLSRSNAH